MSPRRKRVPKVKDFTAQCVKDGILSPSDMARFYNQKYPLKKKGVLKPKSPDAFRKAIRRLGISAQQRVNLQYQARKSKELTDIEDYEEVQNYLNQARFGTSPITKQQIRKTMFNLRKLWTWMSKRGFPNPREWTPTELGKCMMENVGKDESGQWKNKHAILDVYGAFNRCFQGKLPQGWSANLKRPAGELKDFFEYEEFDEFDEHLTDTESMSREGWRATFSEQVNSGAREGVLGKTGILSLRWENINYNEKRCSIRDKGKRGKPARLWTNVPLGHLFPWIHGWEKLLRWHELKYAYVPTQAKHADGLCFPVSYTEYRLQFHRTRRKCNSRINRDLETLRPHILRKTHAQWCHRIGVSLENLCGDTTGGDVCDGRYGVGWTDATVPLRYYLTKEAYEYAEQDEKIQKRLKERVNPRLKELGLASP